MEKKMSKNSMEEKLQKLNDFLKKYVALNSRPPTLREICLALNIKSTSTVSVYLRKLEERGEISITSQLSRGICIENSIFNECDFQLVPLIGEITAGSPILAKEETLESFFLPNNLFKNNGQLLFMLTVSGSSMVEIGINNGDFLIIKKQNHAKNGQVIAALIDNELATVKRYFNDEKGLRLHPENKNMIDIYPEPDGFIILGIVIGLLRTEVK